MTDQAQTPRTRVAIDIAKWSHTLLIEFPDGKRCSYSLARQRAAIDGFVALLRE